MKIHYTVPATATEAAHVKSRESSHRPLNTKVGGGGSRLFEIIQSSLAMQKWFVIPVRK